MRGFSLSLVACALLHCSTDTFVSDAGTDATTDGSTTGEGGTDAKPVPDAGKGDADGGCPFVQSTECGTGNGLCDDGGVCCISSTSAGCGGVCAGTSSTFECLRSFECNKDGGTSSVCCLSGATFDGGCPEKVTSGGTMCVPLSTCPALDFQLCTGAGGDCPVSTTCVQAQIGPVMFGICQ